MPTLARKPKPKRQSALPLWLLEQIAGREQEERGIVPLESNALALRYDRLRPGPALALEPHPSGLQRVLA